MMPISSISAGLAWPTAYSVTQRRIGRTSCSRAAGVSSLESARPGGTRPIDGVITTTPMVTGPASAPRPTSSIAASRVGPPRKSSFSKRRLGRRITGFAG